MLTIEHKNQGYQVRAKEAGYGRGPTTFARDLDEVLEAVEHYYRGHTDGRGSRPESCPFCRDMEKEGR